MASLTILAAVSGGIDSMLMLDELAKTSHTIVVGHVNHGLRAEAGRDEAFVRQAAHDRGLVFVNRQLQLRGKSEAEARRARWQALREMAAANEAIIATAHHQDDVLETILINLVRGTGWRGLATLRPTAEIMRPLLHLSKAEVVEQAIAWGLEWRDDETNFDVRYLRNYLRARVVPRFSPLQRRVLAGLWERQCRLRTEVENLSWPEMIRRHDIIMSEPTLAAEIMRSWLASHGIMVGEAHRLALLVAHAKAARPRTRLPLPGHHWLVALARDLMIE